MVNNLYINDLIEWEDNSIERVIWIDEGYIVAFVFDINANKGFPQPKPIKEITNAIAEGGDEIITVDLIHEVSAEGLYLVKPMLDAIRSGDTEWMNKYKDIAPLSTVEYHNKYASKLESKDLKEIRRLASKKQEQQSPILSTVILKLIKELKVDALLAKQCAEKVFVPQQKQHDVQLSVHN